MTQDPSTEAWRDTLLHAVRGSGGDPTKGPIKRAIILLAVPMGFGPNGVFIAIMVSFSTLAVVSGALFKRGKWKKATV